jgi:hypothetical protein
MVDALSSRSTESRIQRSDFSTSTSPTKTTKVTDSTAQTDGVAARSQNAEPTLRPTMTTAADARNIANANPLAIQLRSRAEHSFQAKAEDAGEIDAFAADGSLEDAQKFVEENPLEGNDPAAWTKDQREAFNVIAQDFGARHAEHHRQWHVENGAGGTEGPGSGELFLQFHRDMMTQFTAETGLPVPSGWDPSQPVPEEFTDPAGKDRRSSDPQVELPAWLTADGTGTPGGNEDFGETVTIDGKEYGSLNDFQTPDELGRALGESGYHASTHVRMGGTMGTLESPADATFYAWHGHIDQLIDQWLETDSGQAWAAANPSSPLLESDGHHH